VAVGHIDHQNSYVLLLLFTLWVLSPFAATIWAHTTARRWSPDSQLAVAVVTPLIAVGSLGVYGAVAFGRAQAKIGFVFLVVPFASWVLWAIALAGVQVSRLLRRTGGK